MGCSFANNSATNQSGAMCYKNMHYNIFKNCSFIKNTANTTNGGALFVNGKFTGNIIGNVEFISNFAPKNGGAIYIADTANDNLFENLTFSDNTAKDKDGGAINFHRELFDTIFNNITFFNNHAGDSGGAINTDHNTNNNNEYVNVNFINNTASKGGALNGYGRSYKNSFVGCLFANNSVTANGGAIYYKGNMTSNVFENDSFINNSAGNNGGAIFCYRSSISNKFNKDLFIYNSASNGSVISFNGSNLDSIISDSIFINSNVTNIQVNSGSIQVINSWFGNNATNYNIKPVEGNVKMDNWLFLNTTDDLNTIPILTSSNINFKLFEYNETLQNVSDYDNGRLMPINLTLTSSNGNLNNSVISLGDTVKYTATDAGRGSVTATIGHIFNTIGFDIPKANSTLTIDDNITFDYGGVGSATVTFTNASGVNANVVGQPKAIVNVINNTITVSGLDVGSYILNVTTIVDDNHNTISKTVNITVNKAKTELTASAVITTYNINKYLVITLKNSNGNPISDVNVVVDLNGTKTYLTNSKGQIKISTKGLVPKAYSAKVTFKGNTNYIKSTMNVKVTVKKATPVLAAKKKTFKTVVKPKKYSVVLKDNVEKPIKNAKVIMKVKGKTYRAITNSKGKATFKLTKLNKKGVFKATLAYKGNKYYNKVSKKAKINVIITFKTVSQGSKDKSTVKKIQQALKNKGYYLSYQGHYLKVDGKFDSCTVRSVKVFQHDNGLKVTGKVDEKTAQKIGLI